MDCLNELRQTRLESVLDVENDVMLVQVFPHVALDDMFHYFTEDAG